MHRMICVWFSTFSVSGQLSKTWMMNIACSTVPEAPSPTTQWLMPSLRGWRSSLLFLLMGPWSIIRYLAWFVFSWQNHNLLLNFDWSMSCVCWLLKGFDDGWHKMLGSHCLWHGDSLPCAYNACCRALWFCPSVPGHTHFLFHCAQRNTGFYFVDLFKMENLATFCEYREHLSLIWKWSKYFFKNLSRICSLMLLIQPPRNCYPLNLWGFLFKAQ